MTHHTPAFPVPADRNSRRARAERLADARLYLCTDARQQQGDLEDVLKAALAGGVDIIQLRDKTLDTDAEISALHLLADVAGENEKLFAVNDRADVAAPRRRRHLPHRPARSLPRPGTVPTRLRGADRTFHP
ncbi:thiamine phosphate synthase [Citricoccus parietis]|uniref:Thiamine phosphate synthase n=2 Tax=Citricoccus parietis TaxID=592307 RepID=A0ABV5G7U0_9MICC